MNTKWRVRHGLTVTVFDSPTAAITYWRACLGSVIEHRKLDADGTRLTMWEPGV